MKKIILLAILVFITACSTTTGKPYSPPPPPPEDEALIYLMRSEVVLGAAYPTIFSINDVAVSSLKDKGYFWAHVKPGEHVLSAGTLKRPDNVKLRLNVVAGEVYFIEYTQEYVPHRGNMEIIRKLAPADGANLVEGYTYPQ